MNTTTLLKKMEGGGKLLKKEETYLWKKLVGKADKLFSIRIRNRDKNKPCVSYGATGCENNIAQNCHWIGRAYYSHRRDDKNCAGGCVHCNYYAQEEHKIYFTNRQLKLFGQDWVDEQLFKKNKKKPTIFELLEIINKYS